MDIRPASDAFAANYRRGKPQVVWASMVSDLETPISAYLKLAAGEKHSFLLESVVSGNKKDRYSFIGTRPDLIWKCKRKESFLNREARHGGSYQKQPGTPLDALKKLVAESHIDLPEGFPPIPLSAGLFGFLGYDMIREIEKIPDTRPDPLGLDDAILLRPGLIAVFDAIDNRITLITPVYPVEGGDAGKAYDAAKAVLEGAMQGIRADLPGQKAVKKPELPQDFEGSAKSNTSQEKFCAMVNKAKEYIFAGDIFQVVLSQRFSVPFPLPPFALYRSLRRLNPSPFLFYLDLDGFQLVGSSPEILVRLRDNKVTIRPIAGTRPRGSGNRTDDDLMKDLLADPKERAEHLMLLDLGRNDVGRVSKIGSVKVTEQFQIELYSHVMHIVSNVEGTIEDGKSPLDALFAGFPAGTVSGAPKVRAMEIIDELEAERRDAYAGCVGYIGANGVLDTCIALRTAVVKDGVMYAQAGAGIVADSDPLSEYNECRAKARALIRAAEDALKSA